jgi:hypothetical protein
MWIEGGPLDEFILGGLPLSESLGCFPFSG